MNKRNRLGDTEINLTPLLDVLFTILFIVMIGSMQNQKETQTQAQQQVEQSGQQVARLQQQMEQSGQEIVQLQQQVEHFRQEAKRSDQQLESYDIYNKQAVVITMQNIVEDAEHKLIIAKETETDRDTIIQLGNDRLSYVSNRIYSYISEIAQQDEMQPIYIVFYCDKSQIYTAEFSAIQEELDKLQNEYKEVFYKIVEGE